MSERVSRKLEVALQQAINPHFDTDSPEDEQCDVCNYLYWGTRASNLYRWSQDEGMLDLCQKHARQFGFLW